MARGTIGKGLLFIFTWVALTFLVHEILHGLIIGFDFPYIWHPGRALFEEGINPYSAEVAQRIFISEFHRLNLPSDKLLFLMYPIYILVVPLPLYFMGLDWAASAWLVLNVLVVTSFIPLFFPDVPKWVGLTLVLFYETWFTILIGNYALLIFVTITASLTMLLYREKKNTVIDILCGVALAWATGKPQMVWLLIPMVLLIALRKKRYALIYGFAGGLVSLIALSFLLLPGWVNDWVRVLTIWPEFNPGHKSVLMTFLYTFFSRDLVWIITSGLLVLAISFMAFLGDLWWKGKAPALIFCAFGAFFQNLFDLSGTAPDRLVLLIPLILYVASRPASRSARIVWVSALLITNLLFVVARTGLVPYAGDRYMILFALVFLIFLGVEHRSMFSHRTSVNAKNSPRCTGG